jgi:hypothetical protein
MDRQARRQAGRHAGRRAGRQVRRHAGKEDRANSRSFGIPLQKSLETEETEIRKLFQGTVGSILLAT